MEYTPEDLKRKTCPICGAGLSSYYDDDTWIIGWECGLVLVEGDDGQVYVDANCTNATCILEYMLAKLEPECACVADTQTVQAWREQRPNAIINDREMQEIANRRDATTATLKLWRGG